MAQQPQPGQAQAQSLGLALQQVTSAANIYADAMRRELDAKDARIAELEKLCGELCKPQPERK